MNKEIEKIQKKLNEAKNERIRSEVRYNTHIVIMEGARETLKSLEGITQGLLTGLTVSSNVVGEFNKQLQLLVEKETKEQIEKEDNNEQ